MMAASAAFATPIGCQTNLIVYGPAGTGSGIPASARRSIF
jgi:di/tricarboxylate transporter